MKFLHLFAKNGVNIAFRFRHCPVKKNAQLWITSAFTPFYVSVFFVALVLICIIYVSTRKIQIFGTIRKLIKVTTRYLDL